MFNKIFPAKYEKVFQALVSQGAICEADYDKVHAVLDWSVLDELLAVGEITAKQYDAVFSAMHDNIFAAELAEKRLGRKLPTGFLMPELNCVPNSAGWPFFISPSAFSTITQRNPWQAATEYFDTKMGIYKPGYVREEQQLLFDDGHDFETAFAAAFSRKTGLLWIPSPFTYWNEDNPDILYNTDGWLIEVDAQGKYHLGLYEGKKTNNFSETQRAFYRNEVPPYYQDQLAGYFNGLPFVEFAYINCGWGTNSEKEMRYIRVERDEMYISEVMDIVNEFLSDAKHGIRPTLENITHPAAIQKSAQRIYGNGNKNLPPVLIPASEKAKFTDLAKLDQELLQIAQEKESLLQPIKADMDLLDARVKAIEKSKDKILACLYEVIGDSTEGIFQLGDVTYHVSLPPTETFSFGKVQKSWLKTTHPDVWDEMMRRWQRPRQISYTASEDN